MGQDRLSVKLSQMDVELENLMSRLEKLDHKIINTSPKEGAWSVTQVLNHMKIVEFYTHSYIKKKIQSKDLKKAGLGSKLRLAVLKAYVKSPLSFNAPAAVNTPSLPAEDTIANIKTTWLENRKKLGNFLEGLTEFQRKQLVYKHPAAGRMSFDDMLGFMKAHNIHHAKQIDRTLKELKNQK